MSNLRDLLLWIDLETTGLDPQRDLILEIAVQLTDRDLVPITDPRSWVVKQNFDLVWTQMDSAVRFMHAKSGLLEDLRSVSALDPLMVTDLIICYLDHFVVPGTVRAAGSSVHFDVEFLRYQLPLVYERLHYRQVNVSSIAETVEWWLGVTPFKKRKAHRALDDLRESLDEARHLRQWLRWRCVDSVRGER